MITGTRLMVLVAVCGGLLAAAGGFLGAPLSPAAPAPAQEQPMITPLFFTGVIGGDAAQGRRVLLRWYSVDDLVPLETAVIYRTDNEGTRERITAVRKSRSPALIHSIFYAPGADAARADMQNILEGVYGTWGNSPQEFAHYLVDFLDSAGPGDSARARRQFAAQYNYCVAMIEGQAYLDHVDPAMGPFTYELWQGDSVGNPVDPLGFITIDASEIDVLPAPQELVEVFLLGRDGVTPARGNHRKIFLNWDPIEDPTDRHIVFGYNVYRLPRFLEAGETFDSVRNELVRINDVPVLAPSPIEGEQAGQSYLYADSGDWLDTGSDDDLLTVGDVMTYFAVARDLLGQEGEPSDPLIAVVRDTFEPDMPRGVNVHVVTHNGQPALEVSWLPVEDVDDDLGFYRVYRYQEYGNAGWTGPFPPIDGLTEGRIAQIPVGDFPTGAERLRYIDTDIGAGYHERIFWYSISAVDVHGNESALSPGVFGVIDDWEGPFVTGISRVCRIISNPRITGSVAVSPERTTRPWEPLFVFNRLHHLASHVRVYRVYPASPRTGGEELSVFIGQYNLDARGPVYGTDGPLALDFSEGVPPVYRFELSTADEHTAVVDIPPPDGWTPAGSSRPVYTLDADIDFVRQECINITTLDPVTGTTIPGMNQPPIQFEAECPGDATSMRLLRSVNGGRTWTLVREFDCVGTTVQLQDDYHPESLARVRYSLVALDVHGNPGIPHYLPVDVIFLGQVTPPAPIDAEALGANIPSQRRIRVRWQGPADAIEFYRVHIRPKAPPNPQALAVETFPLEFSVAEARSASPNPDFLYDEVTSIFEMTTGTIDRLGGFIDGNVEYEIQIEAVPHAGSSVYGTRKLSVHWENMDIGAPPHGVLRWAPRPLPPVIDKVYMGDLVHYDPFLRDGSVLVPVTNNSQEFSWEYGEPPLMLWRQRTDKPGQPWVAVTPFLETINMTNGLVDDPFFTVRQHNIWVLDTTGVVQAAQYRYYVMTFDPLDREILGLWGPYDFLALIPQ